MEQQIQLAGSITEIDGSQIVCLACHSYLSLLLVTCRAGSAAVVPQTPWANCPSSCRSIGADANRVFDSGGQVGSQRVMMCPLFL